MTLDCIPGAETIALARRIADVAIELMGMQTVVLRARGREPAAPRHAGGRHEASVAETSVRALREALVQVRNVGGWEGGLYPDRCPHPLPPLLPCEHVGRAPPRLATLATNPLSKLLSVPFARHSLKRETEGLGGRPVPRPLPSSSTASRRLPRSASGSRATRPPPAAVAVVVDGPAALRRLLLLIHLMC